MDDQSTRNPESTPEINPDLDQEPTLPRIPPFPDVYRGKQPGAVNSRKRPHLRDTASFLSTSSDPAVFSSDDDPALENVNRRKKRYVGSWFQAVPNSSDSALGEDMPPPPPPVQPKRNKRTLRRKFDSGVYMSQSGVFDSSDGEADLGLLSDQTTPDDKSVDDDLEAQPHTILPEELPTDETDGSEEEPATFIQVGGQYQPNLLSDAYSRRLAIERAKPKDGSEQEIQEYFRTLVEYGEETVDISHLGLKSISNATVSLLSNLVRIPDVIEDVEFEQPETSIQLMMSTNLLTRIPTSVFQIENLTTLSLRGNKLTELPTSIAGCKSLKSLNVSFNKLRYLPGELLDLVEKGGSLQELQVFGNPFYQRLTKQSPDADLSNNLNYNRLGERTFVQYTDTVGTVYSDFKLDDRELVDLEPDWQLAGPKRGKSEAAASRQALQLSRVPSLMELALRSAARVSRNGVSLAPLLGPQAPDHLRALLDAAADAQYLGLPRCCVCGRAFVRPRAQWLEFLDTTNKYAFSRSGPLAQVHMMDVPFMKKGCSWRCVPEIVPRDPVADDDGDEEA